MTKDTSDVVARLTEPVDWAHFVNDDHAADYQAERAEAAALISSLVAENEDLAETAAKYRVVCDDRDSWRRTAEKCKSEAVEAERLLAEAREAHSWPAEAQFQYGDWVEKFTGEALWSGRVVSAYHTKRLALRYVVEVEPQGFQMIAVPAQLRASIGGVNG